MYHGKHECSNPGWSQKHARYERGETENFQGIHLQKLFNNLNENRNFSERKNGVYLLLGFSYEKKNGDFLYTVNFS